MNDIFILERMKSFEVTKLDLRETEFSLNLIESGSKFVLPSRLLKNPSIYFEGFFCAWLSRPDLIGKFATSFRYF